MTQSIQSQAIKIVCEHGMLVLAKALSRLMLWYAPKSQFQQYQAVYPFASRSFNEDTYTCFDCFLPINGILYAINAILDNAKVNHLPVSITFIDLTNAVGSVSHKLIHDILQYIKVPAEIHVYIYNLYSNLRAFISTPQWSTSTFSIRKGVFQSDTYTQSPLIFLVCFTPIVELANSLSSQGFRVRIPISNSEGLSPVGSHFHVE